MDDEQKLRDELQRIEEAIAVQEGLQDLLPAGQLETALAPLRRRRAELLARLGGEAPAARRPPGQRQRAGGGATVGDSVTTGGGAFVGRDLVVHARQVSGDFWQQFGRTRPDLERATTRYLTQLANRYQFLNLKGMGVSDRVPLRLPLAEMYVPLKARIELPEGETWARDLRLAGRRLSEEEAEAAGRRLSAPQPLLDLLQQQDGLIILGDPGAGKTTFLKYLAVRLALGQGEALGLGNRLPVLLPLSAYANALAQGDIPLHRFIARYYEELGVDEPLGPVLDEALDRGGALLLLDGLDEVKEVARRHTVVKRVLDFFAYRQQDGNKFILTSRLVGYREVRPVGTKMAECTLVDFDEEEIELFVTKWTAALERAARGAGDVATREAAREREELLASVRHNPGVRRLAANPLLLTILALMKRQGVLLPERRVELYEQYVRTLLKHWNLARGLGRPAAGDLDVVETLRVLAPLALWMHESSPGVGLVKGEALRRRLAAIYRARGSEEPEKAARHLLADVRDHAGLLVERGHRMYGFIHLTFQEYLAAVAIAQQGQREVGPVVETLAARVGDDNWHEVFLLAIGYLGIVQQRDEAAGEVLLRLLEERPGPPGAVEALAGEAVADAWPGGVTPACRRRVVDVLQETMRAGERVAPPERAAAGRVLARVGDPRPEVMTVDGMELCYVPPGPFWMGSEEGKANEKPQHWLEIPYGYWLGRYPVTQAQFAAFVEAGGYGEGGYWAEAQAEGFWQDGRFQARFDDEARARPRQLRDPFMLPNHPVAGITWYEALAFTRWLTERWQAAGRLPSAWQVVLPGEAEWEKGARGGGQVPGAAVVGPLPEPAANLSPAVILEANAGAQAVYPWGDERPANRANYKESGIGSSSAAGCFPGGKSVYGLEELAGNVFEWTRSHWRNHKYDAADGRERLDAGAATGRVLRGGSHFSDESRLRCAARGMADPYNWGGDYGFRVCVSPISIPPSER